MKFGMLHSRIREDEKLILRELRERGHEARPIDVRDVCFDLTRAPELFEDLDLVLNRCLAASQTRYVTRFVDAYGVPVVNHPDTAGLCSDKVRGSLALAAAGVPTPRTEVSFTIESALESAERLGYPCVLKPVVGSWGRLVAKLESPTAAEAVLEHKDQLGHYEHKVFYLQEWVEKPGRDIRVLVTDDEPVAAMTRESAHWRTNAARGASTHAHEIDDELADLVVRAAAAVGGGLLGVDVMETGGVSAPGGSEARQTQSDAGYTVHEVNTTVEFKALTAAVPDVDVPGRIVDWLERRARSA